MRDRFAVRLLAGLLLVTLIISLALSTGLTRMMSSGITATVSHDLQSHAKAPL